MGTWVIPIIVASVLVALAVARLLRSGRSSSVGDVLTSPDEPAGMRARKLDAVDETPDEPVAFGYKIIWIAIGTSSAEAVLRALQVEQVRRANWETGLDAAYAGHLFISPIVDDWVFVVSTTLPELGAEQSAEQWSWLMQRLAAQFSDVQYFASHRVVGYFGWARFQGGNEQRAFAYLGERGETLVDRGEPTVGERELGHNFFNAASREAGAGDDWLREELRCPDEEDVLQVAGKWGINPMTLEDQQYPCSTGWVGAMRRELTNR